MPAYEVCTRHTSIRWPWPWPWITGGSKLRNLSSRSRPLVRLLAATWHGQDPPLFLTHQTGCQFITERSLSLISSKCRLNLSSAVWIRRAIKQITGWSVIALCALLIT